MRWNEVERRIQADEDLHTEFKQEPGDLSGLGRALCAFANSDGGLIVLGVSDSGEVVGVPGNPQAVHERLTSFLHSGCSAPVMADYGRHEHHGRWVHWIEVPRVRGFDPLRYKKTFWVRRQRSSVEPSSTELQELLKAFGFRLTEEQMVPLTSGDDIDPRVFAKFLRARGFHTEEDSQPTTVADMRNFGLVREYGGQSYATLYGILGFGRAPQEHLHTTSFLVRCAAYEGMDRGTEVILASEAYGQLDEQVQRALGWFRSLGWKEKYEGALREDIPRLPPEALREALVNAVAHRDYAVTGSAVLLDVFPDRAEVTSPGILPNHLPVEAVLAGGGPRSRNEMMANFLVEARMMEKRGRGWLVMRNAMQKFNGTEPELTNDTDSDFVRVTLYLYPADGATIRKEHRS